MPTRWPSFATHAEALGFDTIWLSDVPLGADRRPLAHPHRPGRRRPTLKLGANIVPIGRNPMILARQLAQLDQQSAAGCCCRSCPASISPASAAPSASRPATAGALIEATSGCFGDGGPASRSTTTTTRSTSTASRSAPTPLQDPLEIWLGGTGPRALVRVGRSATAG